MRVIYVAKHDSGGNDDEGAIAHALERLGCQVIRVQEARARRVPEGDLLLFHKWQDWRAISASSCRRKAFWYFDLVNAGDPAVIHRSTSRMQWMDRALKLADVGFCTDGDWAARDGTGKLRTLRQGADERIVGKGKEYGQKVPALVTASFAAGKRAEWLKQARRLVPELVLVERGLYREKLRDAIAGAAVYLCPAEPATDRYWSNRVYNACGFAACALHPRCAALEYSEAEVAQYSSKEEMVEQLKALLADEPRRQWMQDAALERTRSNLLYRHRCEQLLEAI